MSIKSSAGRAGAVLARPFHRDGAPTRLHPTSLWAEGSKVATLYVGPAAGKVRAWLDRWVRPALATVSALGAVVIGAVVVLWITGAAFGWQEAKVAALLATLLVLIAIAFILGNSMYAVKLDLARTRVAVGDSAVGSIAVTNASTRPVLPSALELPVGAATALFHLPRMGPGQVHEDLFTIPTTRRAVITVGPVRSVRADPLHLLRRQLMWTEPTDLFVHPRTTALDGPAAGFLKDLEGLPTTELSSADVAFHALREYVPGDDRRHIHWKTTARTGKLMVRQFEETRRAHMAVALSVNTDEYEREEDFELAISAAASLARQAIKEARELSVVTQRGPVRCETGKNMLDDMTRLAGHNRRGTAVDLARSLSDAVPNASVVFFVVGSKVTPSQLRSAAASVPPGVRAFAVRCYSGAKSARANIAELTVLTLGDLTDLAAVLRKAVA
ncbi:DUF58 domain-containing protein [Arthrobacter livingstonensis]|uniref:DUF58 domain-containing protein n=1 Tax=Arthrobacter livingstonensis TaxID=670078 RepID=A0A2V5LWV4_9MICC|nr:DUF58 domain-containing protein [Arthrobacter livingstonensis]PYI66766.1 DUF58 domain-containing protein [Arthrobacter livingstonensis]